MEQKVGFLRLEDADVEELDQVSTQIEENLADNYNIVVMDQQINWADPDEMMELFISMFHFIEASCYKDKAEAIQKTRPGNQQNLRQVGYID